MTLLQARDIKYISCPLNEQSLRLFIANSPLLLLLLMLAGILSP